MTDQRMALLARLEHATTSTQPDVLRAALAWASEELMEADVTDLPGLRLLIRIYDRVNRGDLKRLGELRQLMDSYGITPKGQQDRRWLRPEPPRTSRFTSQPVRRRPGWDPRSVLRTGYDPEAGTYLQDSREQASAKERLKRLMAEQAAGAGETP